MAVVQRLVRHLWLVIAAPLIVGVVVGVAVARLTGVGVTHSHGRTDVRLFDVNGELAVNGGPKVVGHGSGTCGPVSEVDPAPLVVSCDSANGGIYLTCFGAYTPDAICANSPWTRRAFALHVTLYYFSVGTGRKALGVQWNPQSLKKLPPKRTEFWARSTKQFEEKPAWALELSSGQKCVRQWRRPGQGSMDVRGIPTTYECNANGEINGDVNSPVIPKGPVGFVIGEPDRSTEPWTADFIAAGSTATTQVSVTTAWY
jgi:hypothetical protein